jgi:hypothetical protein
VTSFPPIAIPELGITSVTDMVSPAPANVVKLVLASAPLPHSSSDATVIVCVPTNKPIGTRAVSFVLAVVEEISERLTGVPANPIDACTSSTEASTGKPVSST